MCSNIAKINVNFFEMQVTFVNYIVGQFWYTPTANVGKEIRRNWTITWISWYTFGVKRFFDKTSSFSMYRFCSTKIYMHTRHLKRFQRGKKKFLSYVCRRLLYFTPYPIYVSMGTVRTLSGKFLSLVLRIDFIIFGSFAAI